MGTGDKILRSNLRWTSIPSTVGGSSNSPSRLRAIEIGISFGSVGQFGPSTALPLPYLQIKSFIVDHKFLYQWNSHCLNDVNLKNFIQLQVKYSNRWFLTKSGHNHDFECNLR